MSAFDTLEGFFNERQLVEALKNFEREIKARLEKLEKGIEDARKEIANAGAGRSGASEAG